MQAGVPEKLMSCFIPLLIDQMLLCAASVFFADAPALGLLAGHVPVTAMCIFILRGDAAQNIYEMQTTCKQREMPELRANQEPQPDRERLGESSKGDNGSCGIYATRPRAMGRIEILIWVAASCAICLGCTYFLNITGLAKADRAYAEADTVIEAAPALARFALVIIVAPVSEELLYRGVLYHRAAGYFGEKAGFAASVAAFAVSHGNLTQAIAACLSAVLLTAACRRCDLDFSARRQSRCDPDFSARRQSGQDQGCKNPGRGVKSRAAIRKSRAMDIVGRMWLPILLHSVFNACSLYVVPRL